MLIEKTDKPSGIFEDALTEGDSSPINPASCDRDSGNSEKWDGNHNQDQDYTAPPGGPTASSGTLIPAPSNHVHILKRDGSIRGTWNIDPGLQIPSSLLPSSPTRADTNHAKSKIWKDASDVNIPVDATGPQPNLMLHTRDGKVFADVWISDSEKQDESKPTPPTLLDVNTRDGGVTLRLRPDGTRPLDIRIHTNDAPITVFLPRSFTGLILHDIRDGKLLFSPAMEGMMKTFSAIQGKFGSSFIGDWRSLMNGDEVTIEHWDGDKCQVATKDGSIYFFWEDEFEEVMAKRKIAISGPERLPTPPFHQSDDSSVKTQESYGKIMEALSRTRLSQTFQPWSSPTESSEEPRLGPAMDWPSQPEQSEEEVDIRPWVSTTWKLHKIYHQRVRPRHLVTAQQAYFYLDSGNPGPPLAGYFTQDDEDISVDQH